MDEQRERQLGRLREWYKALTEEQKEKRRAQQREYRRHQRAVAKDEINARKRQHRAANQDKENARQRQYYEEHKEQFAEYAQRHRAKPETLQRERQYLSANKDRINDRRREKRDSDPEVQQWRERQAFFHKNPAARAAFWRHGKALTWEQFKALYFKALVGPCDICGIVKNGKHVRFHMDHVHKTNVYRGVLCHRCNAALGLFRDSASLLREAANYLERF